MTERAVYTLIRKGEAKPEKFTDPEKAAAAYYDTPNAKAPKMLLERDGHPPKFVAETKKVPTGSTGKLEVLKQLRHDLPESKPFGMAFERISAQRPPSYESKGKQQQVPVKDHGKESTRSTEQRESSRSLDRG